MSDRWQAEWINSRTRCKRCGLGILGCYCTYIEYYKEEKKEEKK